MRLPPAPVGNRFRSILGCPRSRPLVVAHRGDSSHAPENTLEAARLGWKARADAWELDVQLTRDRVPVVLHDESLLRTTDVARRYEGDRRSTAGYLVSDFDLAEIRELDAGSWFLAAEGPRTASCFGTIGEIEPDVRRAITSGSCRIPTLFEALVLTDALDWLVNVELKSFPNTEPALLERVLAAIDDSRTPQRVLLSSFDHADVARAARQRPEIATGVLVSTPLFAPDVYVRELVRADFYHPSTLALGEGSDDYRFRPSATSLRTTDLSALRDAGVPVLAFTVNDASSNGLAVHLCQAGVSGFFTDDPRRLRQLFEAAGTDP